MKNLALKPRKRRWLRVILWIVGVIIFLPLFVVLLFQLAPVQNFARSKVQSFLRNKFHTTVLIGQLKLTWWNSLSLQKVYLGDKDDKALLYSGSLNVSFNLLDLINNKLVVKKLDWDDLLVNIYRLPGDTTYNYQFIVDAFSSGQQKDTLNESGATMTYSIGDVSITNCRLRFADAPANMIAIAMWKSLVIKPESIQPENSFYNVNEFAVQDCKFVYDDKSSGTNTSWSVADLAFDKVVFDAKNKRIEAKDIKIHRTGGGFGTRLEENIVTKVKDTVATVIATDTTVKTAWGFKVKNIDFDQLGFRYDKSGTAIKKKELDFNHLALNNIRVQAKDVAFNTDSILINLDELTLKDKSGFAVQQCQGDLMYSTKVMALKNLLLQADLKPLFPKKIKASGNVTGSLDRMEMAELSVEDNDGTKLYVTGTLQNANNPNKIVATLQQIDLRSGDRSLRAWLPAGTVPANISIPSWFHLQGGATYSKDNFLATNLRFNSSLGDLTVSGTASNYTDKINSRYNLNIPLLKMDVGRLIRDTTIGLINASLSVKGRGYDYKTLTANISLLLKEAVYKKYHYHDINSTAALDKGSFDLYLQSNDPNAQAKIQLKGLLDTLKGNIYGTADINKFDLYATHFSATPMATKGNIVLDIPGIQPRHLNGEILMSDIQFADDSTIYALDTLRLIASDTSNQQQINVSGPFGFIAANGDYDYTKVFTDISAMLQQHLQSAVSRKPFVEKEKQIMDLNASVKWPKSLRQLVPGLDMNKPLILTGHLNTDSSLLNLSFLLPAVSFNEFRLDTLRGIVNSSTEDLTANIYFARLSNPIFPLEKTTLDVIAKNGMLDADVKLLDIINKTNYAFGTKVNFLPNNAISLSLKPEIILNKNPYDVWANNAILIADGGLRSADLTISARQDSLGFKTISLSVKGNTPALGLYDINAALTGKNNDVRVTGNYGKELNMNVDLKKLDMASIEPLTTAFAKRLRGTTTGQLSIKGTASNPLIRGTLQFDSVGAGITAIGNYLKIPSDQIVFDEQGIKLNQFEITDSLNNKAVLDGQILTKDYKDYRFQLTLDASNFMAIGPKQSPDQMFYGPTFVDATARIRGNQNLPRVDLNLTLKDSSNFTMVVPESNPGVVDREGVIVFVDKDSDLDSSLLRIKDTIKLAKPQGLKGLALTARVEITPNSLLKVIVDQQNGDYLEVRGKANLDASMTPNSDLNLTGRYEIDEGKYNMSLNNLIKRTFNIEKGSTITFQGGMTDALVDITARYRVEAVAGDLVEDQLSGASDTRRTQFKQKVPVDVYLVIKNQLLKPAISFRLDMPERERNALNGVIYNRIKQINLVESELNKQVMGLLVLNSFIPENPMALLNERSGSGVEGAARKSASKLISQQLNNFAGSLIKGFDVNFDLNSEDDYSTGKLQNRTDLNIGVSKSLFNDRVSVSVGSSVNLEGASPTQQASTLVGDVSVDYKITPDGKYRIRAYRQNETDAIVEGQIIETGASFIFMVDYNEFRELFHGKKKKANNIKPKP